MKNRKEYDSIGQINVPVDKSWGASTQRSSKYFDIGDFLVRPVLIKSIAIIKKAAAITNYKNKYLDKPGVEGRLDSQVIPTKTKELRAQQDILLAQLEIIQRQQDEMLQLRDAAAGALEGSLKTNIASVLKGEESSIKDAAIKIAQGAIGGVADKLAEQMTGKIMDKLMKVEDPA